MVRQMLDIQQSSSGDIDIVDGDIVIVDATRQHQRDLILTAQGEMKHAPDRGVGAIDYIDDESTEDFMREVRRQFAKDGMKVERVSQSKGVITTNAYYE